MSKRKKAGTSGIIYSTDPDYRFNEENDRSETLPPSGQRLSVKLDTKYRKGKVVTLIEGFTGRKEDLESLGKKLKTACGTGGSAKDGIILVQGDHYAQVKNLLKSWGYGIR
jgi:translation initiation factor 1